MTKSDAPPSAADSTRRLCEPSLTYAARPRDATGGRAAAAGVRVTAGDVTRTAASRPSSPTGVGDREYRSRGVKPTFGVGMRRGVALHAS